MPEKKWVQQKKEEERKRLDRFCNWYNNYYLVDHNFAQNREEESGLAICHGRSSDVEVTTSKILFALDVDAWLEETVVAATHLATRILCQ